MKTIHLSATEARNNFFNILNQVLYEGVQVVIEKAGVKREVLLHLKPSKEERAKDIDNALKKTFGMIPDFPDVTKTRKSRKKFLDL